MPIRSFQFEVELGRAIDEILPVPLFYEDLSMAYAPAYNMMQGTGRINSWLSRYGGMLSLLSTRVKLFWNQCPVSTDSLPTYFFTSVLLFKLKKIRQRLFG